MILPRLFSAVHRTVLCSALLYVFNLLLAFTTNCCSAILCNPQSLHIACQMLNVSRWQKYAILFLSSLLTIVTTFLLFFLTFFFKIHFTINGGKSIYMYLTHIQTAIIYSKPWLKRNSQLSLTLDLWRSIYFLTHCIIETYQKITLVYQLGLPSILKAKRRRSIQRPKQFGI